MMINKTILNRFFFRKNQDSSSDYYLPLLFMLIVSLSTLLIFISSLQLYDFQIKKDKFLSNKWNHIYELFVGSTEFDVEGKEYIKKGKKGKKGKKKYTKSYFAFEKFVKSMENLEGSNLFSFYHGSYPDMLHLSSEHEDMPLVLSYTFDYRDSTLFNSISDFDIEYIQNQPTIYLDDGLMLNLQVKEGDFIFAKQSRVEGYKGLFKVKKIKGDTRLKCYVFSDFMSLQSNLIRFHFNNIDSAFNFTKDLYRTLEMPTPYNFGYNTISSKGIDKNRIFSSTLFTLINKKRDYYSGVKISRTDHRKVLISGRKDILKKGDIITHVNDNQIYDIDEFKKYINISLDDKIKINIVRKRGTRKEKQREVILLDINKKNKNLYEQLGFDIVPYQENTLMSFSTLKNIVTDNLEEEYINFIVSKDNINDTIIVPYQRVTKKINNLHVIEKPRVYIDQFLIENRNILDINIPRLPKDFYIELDIFRSLKYRSDSGRLDTTTNKIQLGLLDYINRADSISIKQDTAFPKISDKKYFMYAANLDNDSLNIDIMTQLNNMNVRWDNGRWKTIINLNKSLKEGKKNINILIITNFLAFLLILIIKFLLRLKLELHTIGVLKCFGYSKKVIFTTYNLGNLIIIILGFCLGFLPIGILVAKFLGYNFEMILGFYNSIYVNYSLLFLLAISLVSLVTTTLFLHRFTEKENIYELIKYEG